MKTDELLETSLDALKQLREELHGKAEDGVIHGLDEVIVRLESARDGKSEKAMSATEILVLVGAALQVLKDLLSFFDS